MKKLGPPQSGKLGNIVAFKSRFGQCEREHVATTPHWTEAQLQAQNQFGGSALRWSDLTDEEAAAWSEVGRQTRSQRRGGQSGPLTGQMLFTQINRNQALLGLPPLRRPAERPVFAPFELVRLLPVLHHGTLALKLSVAKASEGYTLVYGSRSFNAGRRYCDKFLYLGALPASAASERIITEMYARRYERPRPGSRIFIRTVQQINGWRGFPQVTSAIIPATDSPAAQPKRRRSTPRPS